jgi:hypothetical protein
VRPFDAPKDLRKAQAPILSPSDKPLSGTFNTGSLLGALEEVKIGREKWFFNAKLLKLLKHDRHDFSPCKTHHTLGSKPDQRGMRNSPDSLNPVKWS